MRVSLFQQTLGHFLRPSTLTPRFGISARWAHTDSGAQETTQTSAQSTTIPQPSPFVPDVDTFLTLIGRGLRQHASKFPSWESLFSLTSDQMRELGIEPPRSRRYLLQWRQKFRNGKFGPGGDAKHVVDGKAELRIAKVTHVHESQGERVQRLVINTPPNTKVEDIPKSEWVRLAGYNVKAINTIKGPYARPEKGSGISSLTVTEGLWEEKQGHKVDGGERRRAQVRFMKRVAERRAAREARGH